MIRKTRIDERNCLLVTPSHYDYEVDNTENQMNAKQKRN